MKSKKITLILINFKRGGTEWVMTNLANEFCRIGFQVRVLSIKKGNMSDELDNNVEFQHFSGNYWLGTKKMFQSIKGNSGILICSQHGASALTYILTKITRFKGTLWLREPDSNFAHYQSQRSPLKAWLLLHVLKKAYRKASNLIVHSYATEASLISSKVIKKKSQNVVKIGNPISINKICEKSNQKLDLELNLNNQKYIVSAGRLVKHKNIHQLIHSMTHLDPSIHLVIIGDGPEKENLKSLVGLLKLKNRVYFVGQLDNPYPLIKYSNVLVSIGQWEGFGMIVAEALALGTKVVALKNEQGPEIILESGKYGFLSQNSESLSLAKTIDHALKSDLDKEKMFERAKHFDAKNIVEQYLNLLSIN